MSAPESSSHSLAAIVLAAGASSRMGSPKALLKFEDETFLSRLARLLGTVADPIIVVLGSHREEILSSLPPSLNLTFVVNPQPERGMLSSLQCGLRAVPPAAAGVLFTPVDYPAVWPETVTRLASEFLHLRAPVVAPEYQGRHGHPVCVSREVIEQLLNLPSGARASSVIHRHAETTVFLRVADPGVVTDVDDPEAYRALASLARRAL